MKNTIRVLEEMVLELQKCNFAIYQEKAWETAIYPNKGNNVIYPTLGLIGEAGEIANKIKKIQRDFGGKITLEMKKTLKDELGDVLWYLASLATELTYSLSEIAESNIEKLKKRKEKNTLHGSGDNR